MVYGNFNAGCVSFFYQNTETYKIVKVKIITLKIHIYHVARSVCQFYILALFFLEYFKEVYIL